MNVRRREFLISTLGAASLYHMGPGALLAGASTSAKKTPIGIQLYAVRAEFDKDVPGTMKAIADIGYRGVEFWGYGGGKNVYKEWSAQKLRGLLDECGLKCCGMHLQLKAIQGDTLQHTVEVNRILGNKFLVVAAAQEPMSSPEAIGQFAMLLNETAVKAKALDMRVGYHCHGFDLKQFDGRSAWDILFSQTTPDVVMQLDTGNCFGGGGDPVGILKRFPGRATTIHFKEYENALFAPHDAAWTEIIRLCKTEQNTEWYIIEQGGEGGAGFDECRRCFQNLRKIV